eukprot:1159853-Rhodomonas_salina.1
MRPLPVARPSQLWKPLRLTPSLVVTVSHQNLVPGTATSTTTTSTTSGSSGAASKIHRSRASSSISNCSSDGSYH